MAKHFNGLTPAEAELLALLAEEMGEAIQCIGKILRHGYESVDPTWTGPEDHRAPTNRENLEAELGDVMCTIELMGADLHFPAIVQQCARKHKSVQRWLHHQQSVRTPA